MAHTKEELDKLGHEWREKTEDMFDQVVLILANHHVGVLSGLPRPVSEFGTPYEVTSEDYFTRDEARSACLAHFQDIANKRAYVELEERSNRDQGGEPFAAYERHKDLPAIVVFRRRPILPPPRRELEPGTGFDHGKPEHYTGRIVHGWSARYHTLSIGRYMEWWHVIAFSHEPGRRHGG